MTEEYVRYKALCYSQFDRPVQILKNVLNIDIVCVAFWALWGNFVFCINSKFYTYVETWNNLSNRTWGVMLVAGPSSLS